MRQEKKKSEIVHSIILPDPLPKNKKKSENYFKACAIGEKAATTTTQIKQLYIAI